MPYNLLFRCVNPMLTIATLLAADYSIFENTLGLKGRVRLVKQRQSPASDHIASAYLYQEWENLDLTNPAESRADCQQKGLSYRNMDRTRPSVNSADVTAPADNCVVSDSASYQLFLSTPLASAVKCTKCRDTGTKNFDPASVHSAWSQLSNVEIREQRILIQPVSNLLDLISQIRCPICLTSAVKCRDTGTENFNPAGVHSAWPQHRCPICLTSSVKCRDTGTENFDPAGVQSAWPQQSNIEIQKQRISTQPSNVEIRERRILTQPVSNLLDLSSQMWRYGNGEFQPSRCPLCLASAVKCRDTGTENFDPAVVQSAWPQQSNVEIRERRISTQLVSNLLGLSSQM
ncbi:mitochondrial large ribosomal subunit assembly [Homalodisca vitripennis]|nr:mitochondrial large ribosomal subunit assembly [Homalodisca vitripennis]